MQIYYHEEKIAFWKKVLADMGGLKIIPKDIKSNRGSRHYSIHDIADIVKVPPNIQRAIYSACKKFQSFLLIYHVFCGI
jgi:hypothetical protein